MFTSYILAKIRAYFRFRELSNGELRDLLLANTLLKN